jgi:hypothetical protein
MPVGGVRAAKIQSRGARAIAAFVDKSVEPGTQLMTDDYAAYKKIREKYEHSVINTNETKSQINEV